MKPLIKKIHWNVNQSCNMACGFCYLWRYGNTGVFSTEVAKELIHQAAEAKIEWFVFGGGDPLMRKDLPQLLIYAKQLGLKTDLQTNAVLLTDQIFKSIYIYIDKIGLSLDGQDETIHDDIRKYPGHFKMVLKAIEKCQEAKIPVVIRTTVFKSNIGKLSNLGRVLSKYDIIRKWSIREFVPLGRGQINKAKYSITRKEFLNEVNEIKSKNICLPFPIITVVADEMNNCYCLVSQDGLFYTHPQDGIYHSIGKFPLEPLEVIISRIKYNVKLRKSREKKERQAQVAIIVR